MKPRKGMEQFFAVITSMALLITISCQEVSTELANDTNAFMDQVKNNLNKSIEIEDEPISGDSKSELPESEDPLIGTLESEVNNKVISNSYDSETEETVAEKTLKATVSIYVYNEGQAIGLGSGVIVSPNIVATNYHVIEDADEGFVKLVGDEKEYIISKLLNYNIEQDLALLSVPNIGRQAIKMNLKPVKIADKIFAAGNPMGLSGTYSEGIVSSLRNFDGRELIQITAPISSGSSGGPIVNYSGELIGLAVGGILEGQNLNFAIPAVEVYSLMKHKN